MRSVLGPISRIWQFSNDVRVETNIGIGITPLDEMILVWISARFESACDHGHYLKNRSF